MALHQLNRSMEAGVTQYVASAGNTLALINAVGEVRFDLEGETFSMRQGDSVSVEERFDGFYMEAARTEDIRLIVGFGEFRPSAVVGSVVVTGDVTVDNPASSPVPILGNVRVTNPQSAPVPITGTVGANVSGTVNAAITGKGTSAANPLNVASASTITGKGTASTNPLFVEVTKGGGGFSFSDVSSIEISQRTTGWTDGKRLVNFTNGGVIYDIMSSAAFSTSGLLSRNYGYNIQVYVSSEYALLFSLLVAPATGGFSFSKQKANLPMTVPRGAYIAVTGILNRTPNPLCDLFIVHTGGTRAPTVSKHFQPKPLLSRLFGR